MYGYPISSSTATVISVALSAFVWPIYRIKSFVCSTLVEGYGGACPREQGAGGGRTLTPCCMTSWYRQNCLWHELTINFAGVLRFQACCFLPKCKGNNFFYWSYFTINIRPNVDLYVNITARLTRYDPVADYQNRG